MNIFISLTNNFLILISVKLLFPETAFETVAVRKFSGFLDFVLIEWFEIRNRKKSLSTIYIFLWTKLIDVIFLSQAYIYIYIYMKKLYQPIVFPCQ